MLSLASLAVALNLIVNGTFNLLKMTPLKTYVENRSIPTVLNFLDATTRQPTSDEIEETKELSKGVQEY